MKTLNLLFTLPWLDKNKDIRQQIRDMLFDVETQADSDEIHFWSIIDDQTNDFVGLIGLGDELQLLLELQSWVLGQNQNFADLE